MLNRAIFASFWSTSGPRGLGFPRKFKTLGTKQCDVRRSEPRQYKKLRRGWQIFCHLDVKAHAKMSALMTTFAHQPMQQW